MKITNQYGPNTTILLPGSCNAKCDFCFWNRDFVKIKQPSDYLDKVISALDSLPEQFRILSLSGGEPTLSPYFGKLLARLGVYRRSHSLDRVVLTTNGANIDNFIAAIGCVVDHVNISRHAITDKGNLDVFKNGKCPTNDELRDIILRIHSEANCDVTLNCVIYPETTEQFCHDFIEYAKDLGADAVSFRKVASDVSPTETEAKFVSKYGVSSKSDCQVCRGLVQNVGGFEVRWKGSVNEPSITTGGIYEVVIHPDGNLYADWGMKHQLTVTKKPEPVKQEPIHIHHYSNSGGGGCGGKSSGGC
jgi:MoaA/NifB/PqqE/SkfB family radical SAM enzyme